MKVAAVLIGCLVVLASTENASRNDDLEKEVIEWITNIIKAAAKELVPITIKPQERVNNCPTCQCGTARVRRRIVGGTETKILEFPWMALLMHNGEFHCGGSVINDLYVLTAAHCVSGYNKDSMSVRLLEHDRSVANETKPVNRKVAAILTYPQYNSSNTDNDIALLKLDERVDLSKAMKRVKQDDFDDLPGVRSVCLPPNGATFNNFKAVAIGWGATEEDGDYSDKLLKVTVPILSNADCQKTGYGDIITDNMMCAGEPEGRYDACHGDSGGPLHVLNSTTQTYMQAGVVSWGFGCALPNYPGVYSRVNRYLSWIKDNTKDACYCS